MSFSARYPGECDACDHGIRPGQRIRWVAGPASAVPEEVRKVEHVVCPVDPTPCPRCFMVPAANGSCGCEE